MGTAAPSSAGSDSRADAAAVHHFWEQRARHAEQLEQLVVPAALADVVEQRPRGVGGVGDVAAPAAEPPRHPAVHGTERELAGLGAFAHAGHVVQQPADLGAAEVRVEQQPRLAPDHRLGAGAPELLAVVRGAPVLPHDGRRHRLRGRPVPDDGRLALVGDADAGHVGGPLAGLLQSAPGRGQLGLPERLGVLFDPSRLRRAEAGLLLGARQHDAGGVDHERPPARRARVERQHHLARRVAHAALRPSWPRPAARLRWSEMIPATPYPQRPRRLIRTLEGGRAHPVHQVNTLFMRSTTHFTAP